MAASPPMSDLRCHRRRFTARTQNKMATEMNTALWIGLHTVEFTYLQLQKWK